MKVFAISDLHLSSRSEKPMDVFGMVWENHWDEIRTDWRQKVTSEDVVVIAGDISWGMRLEEAVPDLDEIAELPGRKVFIRGNHDYWWASYKKINAVLKPDMYCIQNNAVRLGRYVFCGSRGWTVPEQGAVSTPENAKLLERERGRMELALTAADGIREEGDRLIALIHYPPFNARFEGSVFTELFAKYRVDTVIYGHLHGETSRVRMEYDRGGIRYYLTSCDKLGNRLKLIYDED